MENWGVMKTMSYIDEDTPSSTSIGKASTKTNDSVNISQSKEREDRLSPLIGRANKVAMSPAIVRRGDSMRSNTTTASEMSWDPYLPNTELTDNLPGMEQHLPHPTYDRCYRSTEF